MGQQRLFRTNSPQLVRLSRYTLVTAIGIQPIQQNMRCPFLWVLPTVISLLHHRLLAAHYCWVNSCRLFSSPCQRPEPLALQTTLAPWWATPASPGGNLPTCLTHSGCMMPQSSTYRQQSLLLQPLAPGRLHTLGDNRRHACFIRVV